MAKRRLSKAAKACISHEIAKHCRKKRGKCRKASTRAQAIAIGFSVCRRKGLKSIPNRPR
jgi:hypothetical protein